MSSKNSFIIENCEGKIIDIGSNNGTVFPGGMRDMITSVDLDEYDIPNFVRADAHNLPFEDNEFDTAVLAEVLEHVKDPVKVLREALRVSRRLIITVPNDAEWDDDRLPYDTVDKSVARTGKSRKELAEWGNPDAKDFYTKDDYSHLWHIRWYTKDTLRRDLIKAGVKNFEIYDDLSESGVCWFGVIALK